MKKFSMGKGGFTLIELMIVVAIIGVLAAIAIPNFFLFQLKAKTSEAKTNLAAIRTAEESYYAAFGVYASSNASPVNPGRNVKIMFVNVDGNGQGMDLLGWSPDGYVFFNYAVATGINQYTASASGDLDADNVYQTWGYRKGGSLTGKSHGNGLSCNVSNLNPPETVGPCEASFGRSVF